MSKALKNAGIADKTGLMVATIKAGIFAGVVLASVYFMLGYLGAVTANELLNVSEKATLLSEISNLAFGGAGRVILGATFFLACLSTTTGLIGSVSAYFKSVFPSVSYRCWVLIWTLLSFSFANLGLS